MEKILQALYMVFKMQIKTAIITHSLCVETLCMLSVLLGEMRELLHSHALLVEIINKITFWESHLAI